MKRPRIGITMGDPAGIGPEIVAQILKSNELYRSCRPVVIGSRKLIPVPRDFARQIEWYDIPLAGSVKTGKCSAAAGRVSIRYLHAAISLLKNKQIDGLVTAPISKEAIMKAGIKIHGHTEILAHQAKVKNFAMLMLAGHIRSVMVTRHEALCNVRKKTSSKAIIQNTLLANSFLQKSIGIKKPRIAVCALNPHAGDGGLLGTEEINIISPAIRYLRKIGVSVAGPIPADSAWQAIIAKKYDLLVNMYHDQAMIGLKCFSPDKIVNVTIGLPWVRTSPGHGTAFDIAGKGSADHMPMMEAVRVAVKLCKKNV